MPTAPGLRPQRSVRKCSARHPSVSSHRSAWCGAFPPQTLRWHALTVTDEHDVAPDLDPGVEIHLLDDAGEQRRVRDLFDQIWGSATSVVGTEMIRAIGHAGGYVAAAYADGQIVGGSLGFLGRHAGQPSLHSHVTGVLPGVRRTGLGRAMKLHQRAWAAANGLAWVTWTFDPLVRRNAWFNIGVLGAEVHEYLVDFYGPIDDAVNAGDESDRLLVAWAVDDGAPTRSAGARPDGHRRRADPRRHRRAAPDRSGGRLRMAPPRASGTRGTARRRGSRPRLQPRRRLPRHRQEVHHDRTALRAQGDPAPARRPVPDQLRRADEPADPARAGRGRARRRRHRGVGRVRGRRRADVLVGVRRRGGARDPRGAGAAAGRRRRPAGGRRGHRARARPGAPDGQGGARDGGARRRAAGRGAVVRRRCSA